MKVVALALLACSGAAFAQAECPHASEVGQAQLLGRWRAEFEGVARAGTLLLEKHPLYAESISGTLERAGERRQLAGDVDDGEFTLEESADGVHIAAAWTGAVVEGSCGKEIRGTWQADKDSETYPFVLRKD
jgi:hypothetical protein